MKRTLSLMTKQILVLVTMIFVFVTSSVFPFNLQDISMTYQGVVTDSTGAPIPDGNHNVRFSLWDQPTIGTELWLSTEIASFTSGQFKIESLGPIPIDVLQPAGCDTTTSGCPDLWMEIQIETEIITPRTKFTVVPYAAVAGRLSGDIATEPGVIRLENNNIPIELVALDLSGSPGLVVSNIGSSGLDGVIFEPHTDSSLLRIPLIGSSGLDGISLMSSDTMSSLIVGTGNATIGGKIEMTAQPKDFIINVQGGDAVDITTGQFMGGVTGGNLTLQASSGCCIEYHYDVQLDMPSGTATQSLVRLDGIVDLAVTDLVDENIAQTEWSYITPSGDSSRITVATDSLGGHLTISNIGSSGEDGIIIDGGGGGGGRLALRDLAVGQTIQTEIIALSLVSVEPIMIIREPDALPLDPPVFRLEYDANNRVVERLTSTPGSAGDSAEFHSSGLTFYDEKDFIRIDADPGVGSGGHISLNRIQTGQTVATEIVKLSLEPTEPLIGLRGTDDLPSDLLRAVYVYDNMDRLIRTTYRADPARPGDSLEQTPNGIKIYDSPNEFDYDLSGIHFFDVIGPSFSVSPQGELQARGNGLFATDPGTDFGIGGTFPGVKLFVDGDICATGIIGPCSDLRYKKNIETITDPIEKISKLRGVSFDWKKDEFPEVNFSDKHQLGLIAQEVKEVLPEVVGQGDNGYYFVDYSRLTPVLIEAVKEQQKEIDKQKNKIESLEVELANLKTQIVQNTDLASEVHKLKLLVQNLAATRIKESDIKYSMK